MLRRTVSLLPFFLFLFSILCPTSAWAQQVGGAPVTTAVAEDGQIRVTWNAVPNATSYQVFRAQDGGISGQYHTTSNLTILDGGFGSVVQNRHKYTYKVRGINSVDIGEFGQEASVTMHLAAPKLRAKANNGIIRLTWSTVQDGTLGYYVCRGANGPNASTPLTGNLTNTTDTFYQVTPYSRPMYYWVIAYNLAGYGDFSNKVDAEQTAEDDGTKDSDGTGSDNTGGDDNGGDGNGDNDMGGDPPPPPPPPAHRVKPDYSCACPKFQPAAAGAGSNGPTSGDPVNLATGRESYEPGPDLVVYNPSGPSVSWGRRFRGNEAARGYGSPGLPVGWVHDYDIVIKGPAYPTSWDTLRLVYSNGAWESLAPQLDGNGNPTGAFTRPAGAPYVVTGVAGSTIGTWNSITVTWKSGTRWHFALNGGHNYILVRISNPLGHGINLQWNEYRCLTSVTNDDAETLLSVNYDGSPNEYITSVSDNTGRIVTYTTGTVTGAPLPCLLSVSQVGMVGTSGLPPVRATYGYTVVLWEAQLSSVTVPSPTGTGTSTATIAYDPVTGKVTSQTDANGNQSVFTYNSGTTTVQIKNSTGAVVHTYTQNFDAERRATGTTNVAGTTVTEYADPANPLLATRVADATGKSTSLTYDTFGNVLTSTDARGVVTTYTYSYSAFPLGRLTSVQEGSKPATNFIYFEPSGLMQSATGPAPTGSGQTTVTSSFTYDALGNILTVTKPANWYYSGPTTTTFNYTQDGTYSQTAALGQPLTVTDALGHSSHFRYTTRGELSAAWDALGNRTDYTYNEAGQPLTVVLPVTGQTGTLHGYTQNEYLYPGGPLMAAKVFDESHVQTRVTHFAYGLEGEALGVSGATEPFSKVYDALYRVTSMSDGKGQATTYAYDAAGNVASMTYPGSETVSFPLHDAAGRVLRRIDGNGVVTNYIYNDPEGLLTGIAYPTPSTNDVALTYDAYGRLATRTDGTGTQTTTYGDNDEVTSVITAYTGLPSRTLSYTYFADGSRATLVRPQSGGNQYIYDAAGRLSNLGLAPGHTISYTYLDNNWLESQNSFYSVIRHHTYNALGQLIGLSNKHVSGGVFNEYTNIVHDGTGNRTSVTASHPVTPALSGVASYVYDAKDQLTSETSTRTGAVANSFIYDAAGNPTTFRGVSRAFNTNNQRTGTGFSYDNNGNPTTYRGETLTFDAENHATQFGSVLQAGYTAEGLRAWKQNAAGVRTYFIYDGTYPVEEMDASGNLTAYTNFGPLGLINRKSYLDNLAGTRWFMFDERGNTSMVLCEGGGLDGAGGVSGRSWDAFGQGTLDATYAAYAAYHQIEDNNNPFDGFGGQYGYYTDRETGLVLCSFRYYDSVEGRWLTRDPISYNGGINLYGYVTNNPVNAIDPIGLQGGPPLSTVTTPQGTLEMAAIAAEENGVPLTTRYGLTLFRNVFKIPAVATLKGTDWANEVIRQMKDKLGDAFVQGETKLSTICTYANRSGQQTTTKLVGDYDGRIGNVLLEFKSGWKSGAGIQDVSKQFLDQSRVASQLGYLYRVVSKGPIPPEIRNWMIKQNIKFWEIQQ